jgi:urease accessory protein
MSVVKNRILTGGLLLLFTPLAVAHAGHAMTGGFMSGLLHPLTGLDHLLVMLVVGVLIGLCAGKYPGRWLTGFVAAFVVAMLIGSPGTDVAGLEFLLAMSVLLAGGLLLKAASASNVVVMVFGLSVAGLHGYAHGLEIPAPGMAVDWMLGVALSILMITAAATLLGRWAVSKTQLNHRLHLLGYGVIAIGLVNAVT